jgi:hypothetical protein
MFYPAIDRNVKLAAIKFDAAIIGIAGKPRRFSYLTHNY